LRIRYYAPREQRNAVERFLASVERVLETTPDSVLIDFSNVERLFPCGMLLLMGHIEDWVVRYPGRLTAKYPTDDLVEQMLQHVGVLQKLGLPPRKSISHTDVTRWHYFTGTTVDGEAIEPFMDELSKLVSEAEQKGLYDCIAEAMTNVKHHAYDAEGRWWMFATISDKKVYVAMHDRGASIPATLLAKPSIGDYLRAISLFSTRRGDGQLIAAACGGRTSTQLPYRGKGLPEMLEYTRSTKRSDLAVYSREGFFRLFNVNENYFDTHGRLDRALPGTLLLWKLDLDGDAK
jgi:hypothetical protein